MFDAELIWIGANMMLISQRDQRVRRDYSLATLTALVVQIQILGLQAVKFDRDVSPQISPSGRGLDSIAISDVASSMINN